MSLFFFQVMNLPLLEKKLQGSAISFYKEAGKNEECAEPRDFKSYAHLFYAQKKDSLCGSTYIVSKIQYAEKYKNSPEYQYLFTKGGFVFLKISKGEN